MAPETSRPGPLRAVCDATDRAAAVAAGACIAAIVVITVVAVWYRYVLGAPLSWTEQISRILFVWVTFLGAAVLYRRMIHIVIDMLVIMLPAPIQRLVYWTNQALILVFALMLLWFGGKLALDTLGQTFGALEITPASFYLAAPVSAALILLFWVEKLVDPSKRLPQGDVHL
ncbi:TRAP transporter small permease [Phreatobacter sp.]|uniref:TRAP transporter small permease n=1 Tax=Phreatobacter sp. TaxID=1966341 RepID=UPI003F6F3316